MDGREMVRVGVKNLARHKLRTLLTMLGVIFGVAAVIAMMSIGEGARRQALEQIRLLGTRNIRVQVAKLEGEAAEEAEAKGSPGLTCADAERIRDRLSGVVTISPLRFVEAAVSAHGNSPQGIAVVGIGAEYDDLTNSPVQRGHFISHLDVKTARRVCVLGEEVRRELFGTADPLGQEVRIGEEPFRVVGLMGRKNLREGGTRVLAVRNLNRDVYVPISTTLKRFTDPDTPDLIDEIAVQVKTDAEVVPMSRGIRRVLDVAHRGAADYQIVIPAELLAQAQRTQRIFNVVMGSIAALSLLVGGIGIMNIMLATVTERTREIGIRRAVGASERDILSQFLNETLLLSVGGGLIGIVLGALMALSIHLFAHWETVISPLAVIVSFGVSAAVGIVFGIYPAQQAARKDPIVALRFE